MSVVLLAWVMAIGSPEATETTARAVSAQYHLDVVAERAKRELLTEQEARVAGNAVLITKAIVERKVTVKWEFP